VRAGAYARVVRKVGGGRTAGAGVKVKAGAGAEDSNSNSNSNSLLRTSLRRVSKLKRG
jgi:hypothetical protein